MKTARLGTQRARLGTPSVKPYKVDIRAAADSLPGVARRDEPQQDQNESARAGPDAFRDSFGPGENQQDRRGSDNPNENRYRSTVFANPALPPLSNTRTTNKCSPGLTPSNTMWKSSRGPSVTPSAASTGIQGPASSEYSQRRSGEVWSAASASTSTCRSVRRGAESFTTGGVLSISTGADVCSASLAYSRAFEGRSEATTRK